jgi:hypothetical protein
VTRPRDDSGKELDANFVVELKPTGFDVIFESRGGGVGGPRPVRNEEYGPALRVMLGRMTTAGLVLKNVELATDRAAKITPEDRRLSIGGYPYPISLAAVANPGISGLPSVELLPLLCRGRVRRVATVTNVFCSHLNGQKPPARGLPLRSKIYWLF